MAVKRAAILLAAGRGSRMGTMTANYPKCLLPVGSSVVLETLLSPLIDDTEREIVLVVGYKADAVRSWVKNNYPGANINIVENPSYDKDVNILSVNIGVDSLNYPERGYTIIETDIIIEKKAWERIKLHENREHSFWLTHNCYSQSLTGGIVHIDTATQLIDNIAYVPDYNPDYDGWHKMVGILSVSPNETIMDRKLRARAINESGCAQYYMMPWILHRENLPCIAVDISEYYADSFNVCGDYLSAQQNFLLKEKK